MLRLFRRESILTFSQLFLVVQHRLVQPRNLLSNDVNVGSKQRKLFSPEKFSWVLFALQPLHEQLPAPPVAVRETAKVEGASPAGYHTRSRLTIASFEAPQYPFS